jgi:hypothetical protein
MKEVLAMWFCVVCLGIAGVAAQTHTDGADSKAAFQEWVEQANKAQTYNDAKWMEANFAANYIEGTSFGTWIPKAQVIKDANDPANNKYTKSDISDLQTEIVGDVGVARFKETYDAVVEGQHHARTIICTLTGVKKSGSWKGLSNHCSLVEK